MKIRVAALESVLIHLKLSDIYTVCFAHLGVV